MAISLVWVQRTRSATFDKGKWTAVHSYLVRDSTDQDLTIANIVDTTVTNPITPYLSFGGGTESVAAPFFRFISYTITPVQDGLGKLWVVDFNFDSTVGDATAGPVAADVKTATEVGYTSIEVQTSVQTVDIWRTGATVPTSSNISLPSLIDIAGTKVDSAGEPISMLLPIQNISVRNVKYGRPDYATILAAAGSRNVSAFTLGATGQTFVCAASSLLFVGANTSRIGPNQYEINYQFSYDPTTYHLRQQPLRDIDQRASTTRVTPGSAISAANPERANVVYWKQPFPNEVDFAVLGIVNT